MGMYQREDETLIVMLTLHMTASSRKITAQSFSNANVKLLPSILRQAVYVVVRRLFTYDKG